MKPMDIRMRKIVLIPVLAVCSAFCQIPTNGLVAYYPFTDSAKDESGNNFHGTVFNAVPVDGIFGKALHFANAGIEVAYDSILDNPEAFSVAVLIKSDLAGVAVVSSSIVDIGTYWRRGYGIWSEGNHNSVKGAPLI
jgi:hypothetical protein